MSHDLRKSSFIIQSLITTFSEGANVNRNDRLPNHATD